MGQFTTTNLGECLRRYRQFRDLGMREMARAIGVSLTTYQRMESTPHQPELATMRKLEQWMVRVSNG